MKIVKDFDNEVIIESQKNPIVVQFYADWCGPCQALKPVIESIHKADTRNWEFKLVNVDHDRSLAGSFNIRSIPTLIMFNNKGLIARLSGSKPKHVITNWLDTNLPATEPAIPVIYQEIDEALKKGDLSKAKEFIINSLLKQDSENVLLKLLHAIESIGTNNNRSRSLVEQLQGSDSIGSVVKKVRDLIDIDVDNKNVHTPSSSPFNMSVKNIQEKISINAIDFNLLNQLLHAGINEVREKQGVPHLQPHPILEASARDQNAYMIKHDELSHYQNNDNKRTVQDRILSFGGNEFKAMGENVQYKGFPERITGAKRDVITNSYHETTVELVMNWVNSPGHYKNLISPDFKYVGTSVGWNPENAALFATQVFGA